eukprot:CAMPEP_0119125906 /NCGR_PEP_ID=MMETSP1310-20130426/5024_1 /TAXON_ID=464262 /ORGANISM="Genus nov. species nov., Strain RCC2339" /LENGTH=229 /DNA_ID=CAMNT_0007116025 /DNA_START=420 /DNA_END=1109 /DNA_ORIENTATION=+
MSFLDGTLFPTGWTSGSSHALDVMNAGEVELWEEAEARVKRRVSEELGAHRRVWGERVQRRKDIQAVQEEIQRLVGAMEASWSTSELRDLQDTLSRQQAKLSLLLEEDDADELTRNKSKEELFADMVIALDENEAKVLDPGNYRSAIRHEMDVIREEREAQVLAQQEDQRREVSERQHLLRRATRIEQGKRAISEIVKLMTSETSNAELVRLQERLAEAQERLAVVLDE